MTKREVAKQLKALSGPKGRLAKLRGNESQRSFARKVGMSQQNWNRWESGAVTPTLAKVIELAGKRQVNLNWLLLGKGERYRF